MSALFFSRWWGDPAESLDERRSLQKRCEEYEKRQKEIERRNKARKLKKLVKQAKARELKGQR